MKIFIYIFITLFLVTKISVCQQDNQMFLFENDFFIDANNFKTDKHANIYAINNNELKKYNSKGVLLNSFSTSNKILITDIDVSNPLKIMLFLQNSNSIIFLDNSLNIINSIILDDYEIYSPSIVCNSVSGGFYVYDNIETELFYISNKMKKNSTRGDYFNGNFEPNFLKEYNNKLYISYPDTGIVVLNNFLFQENFIPIKISQNAQLKNNNISFYYKPANEFIIYNQKENSNLKLDIPILEADNVTVEQNFMFILKNKQLYIYKKNTKL